MKKNPRVFIDVQIGNRQVGRIIIELFADLVPKTAENFRGLCTGEYGKGIESHKPLSYVGCKILKIIPGQFIHSGDFVNNDGTGGESVYGGKFADENFTLWHAHAGVVSMANEGSDDNSSQFYITLKKATQLNRRHVVFGQVRAGMDILRAIERLPTDNDDRPRVPVFIVGSGMAKRIPRAPQRKDEDASSGAPMKESAAIQGRRLLQLLLGENDGEEGDAEGSWTSRLLDTQLNNADGGSSDENEVPSPGLAKVDGQIPYDPEAASELLRQATSGTHAQEGDINSLRLTALKRRLNQGRRLNARAVGQVADELKSTDDDPLIRLLRPKRKRLGWSNDPKWYLSETAAVAAQKESAAAKKKRNISFGWDVFDVRSVYKAHEKSIRNTLINKSEYAAQKRAVGARNFYEPQHAALSGTEHKPSDAAKQRLAETLQRKRRRLRHRLDVELGDVDYINKGNRQFNKQLEKAFGQYTVETKQNLERGTAL